MKRLTLLVLLLLCSLPSFGAWAFVQSKEANSTGGTTQAVTFTSTPTVGNIIIVGLETPNAAYGASYIADNQGNAYGVVGWIPQNGAVGAYLYCGIAGTSSGTFTITATLTSSGDATIFAREYSGGSCNIDQSARGTGSTSPYACGSITTLNANDLLVTFINTNNGGTNTYTVPTGYSNLDSQTSGAHQSGAIADKIVSATGTFAPTWTDSATGSIGNCVNVALKEASAGGGSTVTGSFVVAN